MLSREPTRKH